MKTSAEEYMNKLKEIQDSNVSVRTTLPEDEPRFVIDLNTRKIDIPEQFTFLGLLNDTNAETIYFEMDRYFDDVDLSQYTIIVQFAMKNGNVLDDDYVEGVSPVTDIDLTTLDGKIIFGWTITNDITSDVGEMMFSIRIYEVTNSSVDGQQNIFSYCLNTLPVSLPIEDTLDVGSHTNPSYPSYFEEWNQRMVALNEAVENALNKANEALQTSEESVSTVKENAENAKIYAAAAELSKQSAKESENLAKTYENNASQYKDAAKASQDAAKLSETNTAQSESNAEQYKNLAETYKNEAQQFAQQASDTKDSVSGIVNEIQDLSDTAVSNINDAKQEALDRISESSKKVPDVTKDDAGKSLAVNDEGTELVLVDSPPNGYSKHDSNNKFMPLDDSQKKKIIGNPVAIDDVAANTSFQNLKLYGKSTQDGTPSPENPAPITNAGDSGNLSVNITNQNLLSMASRVSSTVDGITFSIDYTEGTVTCSGTAVSNAIFLIAGTEALSLIPKGKYRLSGCPAGSDSGRNYQLQWFRATNSSTPIDYGSGVDVSFESEPNESNIAIIIKSGKTVDNLVFKPLVSPLNNVDFDVNKRTSFALSTPNGLPGIPVDSGGNYTDASGQQWICDEIDFDRGLYIQNIKRLTSADLLTKKFGSVSDQWIYIDSITDIKTFQTWNNYYVGAALCSHFFLITESFPPTATGSFGIWAAFYTEELGYRLAFAWNGVDSFKTFLQENDITLLYATSIPIEKPLSPEELVAYRTLITYDGTTVVSTSEPVNGIEVEYTQKTSEFVDDYVKENLVPVTAAIRPTVSGNPIVCEDSVAWAFQGFKVYGKSTQDSTPSPESKVPIVSAGDGGISKLTVCGKNLVDPAGVSASKTENGITWTVNDDGSITINGTATYRTYLKIFNRFATYGITTLPNGIFTFSVGLKTIPDGLSAVIGHYNGNSYAGNLFTIDHEKNIDTQNVLNCRNLDGYIDVASGTVISNLTLYPQLEIGSNATSYESFAGKRIDISTPNGLLGIPVKSGGNYTDSTGQQWVCNIKDYSSGKYLQRAYKIVLDQNSNIFTAQSGNLTTFSIKLPYMAQKDENFNQSAGGIKIPALSDYYEFTTSGLVGSELDAKFGIYNYRESNVSQLFINDRRFSTIEEYKAWLANNPVTFIYAIETPIQSDIPPEELAAYHALTTYSSTTVVNTAEDVAGMEVRYVADGTKMYEKLDKKISDAITSAITLAQGGNT